MSPVDAAASGFPYQVVTVNGQAPTSLEQFVGDGAFVVRKSGTESTVTGVGSLDDATVRFREKSLAAGKDVRVWQIHQNPDGTYTAQTVPVF
jgi:hypothetical protein